MRSMGLLPSRWQILLTGTAVVGGINSIIVGAHMGVARKLANAMDDSLCAPGRCGRVCRAGETFHALGGKWAIV